MHFPPEHPFRSGGDLLTLIGRTDDWPSIEANTEGSGQADEEGYN